ncbi:hypothetical protein [Actinomadura craniellae]|nr:hypothetical protein [Actinomadura craniellae]
MDVNEILRSAEPAHAVPPMGAGADELLAEITAVPRRAPARRRAPRWTLVPLTAGLALAALAIGWLVPGTFGAAPAEAALDIRREGDQYVITVKDAFAAPERYTEQLHSRGIPVSLRLEPVSPSLEGSISGPHDPRQNGLTLEDVARRRDLISPIQPPGGCVRTVRCPIGVRIPVGYRPHPDADRPGLREIMLGRKARPGERYRAFGQLNNPGEPLACVPFVNQTFGRVRAMLLERGIAVTTVAVPDQGSRAAVPASWYVHEGWANEPGKAVLVADARPGPRPWSLSEQCPKRG